MGALQLRSAVRGLRAGGASAVSEAAIAVHYDSGLLLAASALLNSTWAGWCFPLARLLPQSLR